MVVSVGEKSNKTKKMREKKKRKNYCRKLRTTCLANSSSTKKQIPINIVCHDHCIKIIENFFLRVYRI